jgi:hypothetical protein
VGDGVAKTVTIYLNKVVAASYPVGWMIVERPLVLRRILRTIQALSDGTKLKGVASGFGGGRGRF